MRLSRVIAASVVLLVSIPLSKLSKLIKRLVKDKRTSNKNLIYPCRYVAVDFRAIFNAGSNTEIMNTEKRERENKNICTLLKAVRLINNTKFSTNLSFIHLNCRQQNSPTQYTINPLNSFARNVAMDTGITDFSKGLDENTEDRFISS